MKRKTHRQKVIAIYPTAVLYNGYDIVVRVIQSIGSNGRPDLYTRFWLSKDKYNPKDAWKDAWINIQRQMLLTLEL